MAEAMTVRIYKRKRKVVYGTNALRAISAFRTTPYNALFVVAAMVPINILPSEAQKKCKAKKIAARTPNGIRSKECPVNSNEYGIPLIKAVGHKKLYASSR